MTSEHQALIIAALAALIGAVTFAIKTLATTSANVRQKNADAAFTEAQARAKVAEIEAQARAKVAETAAENEKMEATTQGDTFKVITNRMIKSDDENTNLHKQLRECEVTSKEKDGIIKELRTMNTTLGERNEMQANLLKDSARRIKALEDLNNLQEAKVHELEAFKASTLNDGYGTDKDK